MRRWRGWLVVGFLAGFLAGCGEKEPPTPKLLLYSGAGLRPATAELAEHFERLHHVEIECDYAGSTVLLNRMELTGRGDLFMPGDIQYIQQAEDMGLVEDYRMGCYFLPVILVQKNNPREIESLKDLTQPGIRLALGNAKSCAIGRRTKRLFEKNDISMEEVTPNVVMECMTVNELGSEVKLGMVDAAIVWDAVAAHFQNTCEIVHIPPEKNVISKVAVASLSGSRYPEIAEEFLEFVGSQKGRGIFKKHHFTVTLGEETADLLDASEKTGAEEPNSETPAPDASDGESGEKNASLEAPNSQQE